MAQATGTQGKPKVELTPWDRAFRSAAGNLGIPKDKRDEFQSAVAARWNAVRLDLGNPVDAAVAIIAAQGSPIKVALRPKPTAQAPQA